VPHEIHLWGFYLSAKKVVANTNYIMSKRTRMTVTAVLVATAYSPNVTATESNPHKEVIESRVVARDYMVHKYSNKQEHLASVVLSNGTVRLALR
jgi:hypothetical protein